MAGSGVLSCPRFALFTTQFTRLDDFRLVTPRDGPRHSGQKWHFPVAKNSLPQRSHCCGVTSHSALTRAFRSFVCRLRCAFMQASHILRRPPSGITCPHSLQMLSSFASGRFLFPCTLHHLPIIASSAFASAPRSRSAFSCLPSFSSVSNTPVIWR